MPLNVVATREFRNALTATGALLPGFIAFFGNCLRSNPQITGTAASAWKKEYALGAAHEVYAVDTNPLAFSGDGFAALTFADAGRYLRVHGCVLLGAGVANPSNAHGQQSQVILNPSGLVLQACRRKIERLYVLGTSKAAVDAALSDLPHCHRRATTANRQQPERAAEAMLPAAAAAAAAASREEGEPATGSGRVGGPTLLAPLSPGGGESLTEVTMLRDTIATPNRPSNTASTEEKPAAALNGPVGKRLLLRSVTCPGSSTPPSATAAAQPT
jgi:hypothetical protein